MKTGSGRIASVLRQRSDERRGAGFASVAQISRSEIGMKPPRFTARGLDAVVPSEDASYITFEANSAFSQRALALSPSSDRSQELSCPQAPKGPPREHIAELRSRHRNTIPLSSSHLPLGGVSRRFVAAVTETRSRIATPAPSQPPPLPHPPRHGHASCSCKRRVSSVRSSAP